MISLKKYGIDFEGSIENAVKIMPVNIPDKETIREKNGLRWTKRVSEGRYGFVDEWISADNTSIYEKISKREEGNLLTEACLQIAARNCLRLIGHETSVSEVKYILRSDRRITFMMEPFLEVLYLQNALHFLHGERRMRGETFDFWFLQIFSNICLLLGYLEENLRLNHRDLKGDNILISMKPMTRTYNIPYAGNEWTINVEHEIKLVDFGLSCRSGVNAGTVYEVTDLCPKDGRDIYFLLCYFYAQPTFREMVSRDLLAVIEDWLFEPAGWRVKDFLLRHGLERLSWISFLVNNRNFDCKKCCPVRILNWIATSHPKILKKCVSI